MIIPVLQGVYTNGVGDFRASYPVNLVPVLAETGISKAYLRPADGIVQFATGPGTDRGAINWNDECYRVMGSKLVKVSSAGAVTVLGDVGAGGQVSMDYSFDRLAVASNGMLYYWNGTTLTQVTDTDLGTVLDMIWVDGYFMTTDGTFLVVTELTDPTAVNPLKYGSSEADPDPIKAIKKIRNEPHALNRYTIEAFENVGGALFPFQRIEGAQIQKGTVGTHSCCVLAGALAFVGGGRNEAISVYLGVNGQAQKIGTREVDLILNSLTESQQEAILCEARVENNHSFLYMHLPDRTMVYDAAASAAAGEPIWYVLTSSIAGFSQYRARNHVYCYGEWLVGDPLSVNVGRMDNSLSTHWGNLTGWQFQTMIVFNEARGAVFHELELINIAGGITNEPVVWTSFSTDGETWSAEKPRPAGRYGERHRRIAWFRQGFMKQWRIQRFRGTSDARISIARLEAQLEPLNV